MSYSSKKRQKKLSMLVGMALGAGIVFGMMPSDAAEAANWEIAKNNDGTYVFTKDGVQDGDPVEYTPFINKVKSIVAGTGENVTIIGSNVASGLSSEDLVLGANTVVTVKGSTNKAEISAAETPTNLTVTGAGILGENVNLKSVEVSVKGGQDATIDVTGNIDTLTVKADASQTGNLIIKNSVNVGTLTVADNTKLQTDNNATIAADTLVLDSGARVASNTSVAVNKIVVDASDATASAQLANLKVTSSGGSVEIEVVNAAGANAATIESAITAIKNSGVTVDKTVTTKIPSGGTQTVQQKVEAAFAGDSTKVVLTKSDAQQLDNVTVPAGKTLEVQDGNGGTVSATPKADAQLSYDGSVLSAGKGTAFNNVVVATDKAVKVNIEDAVIDNAVVSNGVLDTKGNSVTVGNLSVTGGEVAAGEGAIKATTANISGGSVSATNLNAGTLAVGSRAKVAAVVEAKEATIAGIVDGSVKADAVTLSGFVNGPIKTDKITVSNINVLMGASVESLSGGSVTLVTDANSLTDEQKKVIESAFGKGTAIKVTDASGSSIADLTGQGGSYTPPSGDDDAKKAAKEQAEGALKKVDESLAAVGGLENLSPERAIAVAKMNPFTEKVPSADEISHLANATTDDIAAVDNAIGELYAAKQALLWAGVDESADEYRAVVEKISALEALLPQDVQGYDDMKKYLKNQAAALTEAVQQAGKTAAAPSVTSARTASVITNVMTQNVVTRTAEIRGFASAVDEGRPAPEKVWFQYKHTNMDVDGGDVYSKSTINTNNFQLGYDTQIGTNDYLGAYIGTTTGNADFRGPARDGRVDIENAFDFGVYGTHMLPNDQYIDYMIHTGKFDSKLSDVKYGTKDTGAMVGYGLKIAQNDNLTLNPYVQLAYDKVDVDSYTIAGNTVTSDNSNNWTAKLGLNLIDASGFYGGLAYSRGLSGSYNAYLNGVPMPTQDNNANVIYLSMGYRAMMSKNALLDLSMEKTFADYKGWTAAGKINFYF